MLKNLRVIISLLLTFAADQFMSIKRKYFIFLFISIFHKVSVSLSNPSKYSSCFIIYWEYNRNKLVKMSMPTTNVHQIYCDTIKHAVFGFDSTNKQDPSAKSAINAFVKTLVRFVKKTEHKSKRNMIFSKLVFI